MKRFAAVLTLALLSPLMAEYLSGSMSFAQIGAFPVMLAMYGGGAIVIREIARRAGRGWPTILLLALAYGLVEEGLADQSLFNPHFLGLRLLDFGFLPALGIGVPWTLYVLAIHVIWSIAVPIALTESLFSERRNEPWLGGAGLVICGLAYVLGVAAITAYFSKTAQFFAPPAQIAGAMAAAAVCVVLAFLLPRPRAKTPGTAPNALLVAAVSFVATSGLVVAYGQGVTLHWPWPLVVAAMLLPIVLVLIFMGGLGRREGWTQRHSCAIAAGATLTYGWSGFFTEKSLHGGAMMIPHAVLAAAILALVVLAWRNADRRYPAL